MTTESTMHISFLGCGSMNEAILGGLLAAGLDPARVTATVRRVERARELRELHGITVLANTEHESANRDAASQADVVILGVKPVGVVELAAEIAPVLKTSTLVISVAAAVSTAMIEAALEPGQPVIRSMPNTPSRLGRGVLSISAGSNATEAHLTNARQLLRAAGTVVDVPESQVDAVSAVSGSGPAYAFYLAEAMAAAGQRLGLDADLSRLLANQTVAGAGFMLAEEGADAAVLRKAVTSPNGTTQRALETFEELGFASIIERGARAATERAAEMTRQLGGAS